MERHSLLRIFIDKSSYFRLVDGGRCCWLDTNRLGSSVDTIWRLGGKAFSTLQICMYFEKSIGPKVLLSTWDVHKSQSGKNRLTCE